MSLPPKPPIDEDASRRGCGIIILAVFLCFVGALALVVFAVRCAWTAGSVASVEQPR